MKNLVMMTMMKVILTEMMISVKKARAGVILNKTQSRKMREEKLNNNSNHHKEVNHKEVNHKEVNHLKGVELLLLKEDDNHDDEYFTR